MASTLLRKPLTMDGITNSACLEKLQKLLSYGFAMEVDSSLPNHIAFKVGLKSPSLTRMVHIEIFTNDKVEIKASQEVASSFSSVCSRIEAMLNEAVDILSRQTSVRAMRARRILEYMTKIPHEDEIGRMIIVTLCDIILDLLVTEKLSRFTSKRAILENESVGAKISMLAQKIPVYKSKEIRDIRMLRNKVAHGGSATAEEEAVFARDETIDIFGKF